MKLRRHIEFVNELKNDSSVGEELKDLIEQDLNKGGFEIVNVFNSNELEDEDYMDKLKDELIGYQETDRDAFFELMFINDPGYKRIRYFLAEIIPNSMVYQKTRDDENIPFEYVLTFNLKKLLKSDFMKSKKSIIKYNL